MPRQRRPPVPPIHGTWSGPPPDISPKLTSAYRSPNHSSADPRLPRSYATARAHGLEPWLCRTTSWWSSSWGQTGTPFERSAVAHGLPPSSGTLRPQGPASWGWHAEGHMSVKIASWEEHLSWLVVDLPLWKIWKSVGTIVPNIWKHEKCSKPPTTKGNGFSRLARRPCYRLRLHGLGYAA